MELTINNGPSTRSCTLQAWCYALLAIFLLKATRTVNNLAVCWTTRLHLATVQSIPSSSRVSTPCKKSPLSHQPVDDLNDLTMLGRRHLYPQPADCTFTFSWTNKLSRKAIRQPSARTCACKTSLHFISKSLALFYACSLCSTGFNRVKPVLGRVITSDSVTFRTCYTASLRSSLWRRAQASILPSPSLFSAINNSVCSKTGYSSTTRKGGSIQSLQIDGWQFVFH